MAKEEKDGKGDAKPKAAKKHLGHIRVEPVRDHKGKVTGYVSHHAYKAHPTDHHTEPERPMAVHSTPEEAGEHVTDQLQQAMGGAQGGGGAEGEAEAAGGAGGGMEEEPEAGE